MSPWCPRELRGDEISCLNVPLNPTEEKPRIPAPRSRPEPDAGGQPWGSDRECREASPILTLDVDGDRGLLPAGNGFVGGAADDVLPVLDVRRSNKKGAHDALPLAIAEESLGRRKGDEKKHGAWFSIF